MNRSRKIAGGIVLLAAFALGAPPRSAPAQIALYPGDEEWAAVTAFAKWESSTGGIICAGVCPGEDSLCCNAAVSPM